jgi:pimeloyl-ACP methyl ester carboxylesterase
MRSATSGSPWSATTPDSRSATRWPRITRTGSTAWPSPRSPGTVTAPPLFLPGPLNDRLWHLGFNRIDKLNEQLVAGREDIFYRWGRRGRQEAPRRRDQLLRPHASNPDSLRGSFGWHRVLDTTIAQDEQRKSRRLTMPVLAIGGEASFGEHVGDAVQVVADDVQSVVIPGTGHFVAEEAPDEMLTALTTFLAPYQDGSAAAHTSRPDVGAVPR